MLRRQKGFTLIEMLITVAIVAILAGLAIPAYSKYVQRARRSDAINALERAAALEERYYFQNNAYGTTANLNLATSPEGYYTISVLALTNIDTSAGYTLEALPVNPGPQTADTDCPTFMVDAQGVRFPSPDPNGCWHR